jgi:hypothetical protein
MVGQDEDRHMVRWIGAPPALPLIVRPGSAHGSEHVAAHNPGAEILERAYREVVVDAGRPAISPQDVPLEGAGWNEPLVQLFAAAAERLVTALVGAGAEAVGRHGKCVHAKLGHGRLLDRRCMEFLNRDVPAVAQHCHPTIGLPPTCGLQRAIHRVGHVNRKPPIETFQCRVRQRDDWETTLRIDKPGVPVHAAPLPGAWRLRR